MSPHFITTDCSGSEDLIKDLSEFAITKNAFVPEACPLTRLPDPYYEPWEEVAQNLPTLIQTGRIHGAIREIPLLSTHRLASPEEWRRAYLLLSFMTHAHIWGGDEPHDVLPPQITVPLLSVSAHLELPPTLSYAAVCLWNFTSLNGDFSDLDNLDTLLTFTGTRSESWFYLVSVAMEAKAAPIIPTMLAALKAVKSRDYRVITSALQHLTSCIEGVGRLLERMYERCDPMTFYRHIRPFMAGTKNMAAAGLPRGLFFDEGNGEGRWRQLRGGSNGQSSMIQFFDIVLGVDHNGHGDPGEDGGEDGFHAQAREYMPGPHRRFLQHVVRMGSIRELALVAPVTDDQHRLREAYTAATDALAHFRNKHIQMVTRYIVIPSRQPWTTAARHNLATSSLARKGEELTGTGGTRLMPFLKQSRDETIVAGRLEKY